MKQEQESFSPESNAFSSFSFAFLLISAKALIDSCIIQVKKKINKELVCTMNGEQECDAVFMLYIM
jgi:hypothetical protein